MFTLKIIQWITGEKLRVVRNIKTLKVKQIQSLEEAVVWLHAEVPISIRSWETEKPKQ